MSGALGLVESVWFFRRGRQYVRIVRVDRRKAGLSLVVDGPGRSHVAHHFDDSMSCAIHQCEIERQLVTASTPWPMDGASTGTRMNTVDTNDITRAMPRPA